ncbi:MAG TPA: hypothetical protein VHN77_05870, partial [Phycisphaerales bacterium]|nr:hypothetical protein [Phycisphaerales bacterium]
MHTRTALSALALTTLAGLAHAQTCPTVNKFDSGASSALDDNFGAAVAMSFGGLNNAPLIAVGQPGEDAPVAGNDAGGFTVYQKPFGSWTVMYDSWNTTGVAGERLGASISLSDPYLLAGAPGFSNSGRARMYRRPSNGSGYTGPIDLVPTIGAIGCDFGRSVAVSSIQGGWAVVGAPLHDFHNEIDAGAAFFYTRDDATNTWNNVYTIWGGDFGGSTTDHRGAAVAMSQTTPYAVVGSPNHENAGQPADHGTVRVVERLANGSPSGQSVELSPPSPEAAEHFGASVAIEVNTIAVGAPDEDMTLQEGGFVQAATNGGAIYIFERDTNAGNTWNFVAKLRSPNPTGNGNFGAKVATDSMQIVVSEPGTKKVYLYTKNGGTWHYQAAISDQDDAANGTFGTSVACRQGDIAIGDMTDDNNSATNPGAMYAFNFEEDLVTGDRCSDALTIPAGDYVGCTSMATPTSVGGTITTCGNGGNGQGNDVWFKFEPQCDGNAIFDTFGSSFDTVLSVHSACPTVLGGNTSITCNDDANFAAPHNRDSLVTFNFTGGETYYVRVTGYNQSSGQFVLRHLYTYQQNNDTCATAASVGSSFGTWNFNTCVATNSAFGLSCGSATNAYNDIWYRWNATTTGPINVNTCGTTFDTVLTVYQGTQQNCPTGASPVVACNDDHADGCSIGNPSLQSDLTFTAQAGQSYMIRVGGYHPTSWGPGQLTIGEGSYCNDIDFNNDGLFPDTQDIDDLLTVFSGGACSTGNCDPIDFNQDGLFPDTLDID